MKGFWGRLFCLHEYKQLKARVVDDELFIMYRCEKCGNIYISTYPYFGFFGDC